ncbi:MAG: class I SAM-dependent methyltransferase [Desulfobacterales bacterium]
METTKSKETFTEFSTEAAHKKKIFLVRGNQKVRIHAESMSKYCLFFRYLEKEILFDASEHASLIVESDTQSIEVGPCRILSGPDRNGHTGRVVFTNPANELPNLIRNKRPIILQSAFDNVHLSLAHKDRIRPSFRDYIANLRYDLQIYKGLFDEIDSKYREEPEGVQNVVQMAVIETEGQNFRRFFEDKLHELNCLVDDFSPEEHRWHGYYFRKQLLDFILCCPFAARAYLKPRGYAGDSEQMRMIYRNEYQGTSTFAKLLHKHSVEHKASQSVRNRIGMIAQRIKNFQGRCRELGHDEKISVLSVGCGPAFELGYIIRSPEDCEKYHFTLFDQDDAALSEAADLIREIEKKLSARLNVDYVRGSVRFMFFSRELHQKWGPFHHIYSLGLFDYLAERTAKAVLDRLFRLLKTGGELVVGNYHVSNSSKYFMEYWGDWPLIHRTEEEFRGLFSNESSGQASINYDDTGVQMFLCIEKLQDNA